MSSKYNYDPFSNNLPSFIDASIKKAMKNLQTCIPAIVKQVISRSQVMVTPAVLQVDSEWNSVQWADITLPVLTPCGGGVFMSYPVAVGDTGWILAGDVDPSLFFKSLKQEEPNTLQRHNYQFGVFIPDKINNYNVSEDDSNSLVISTLDGNTKISLSGSGITITSNSTLNINAQNVNITSSNNANVVIDGINFKNHVHSGSTLTTTATVGSSGTPGTISGNTGVPQ